jgi:hypothetical protein
MVSISLQLLIGRYVLCYLHRIPAIPHISGLVEIINVVSLCGGPVIRSYNAASRRCVASTHEHELNCQRDCLGAFSDRCTSRFGRRRPYLVGGTLLSMGALLLLGYAKGAASIFGLSDEHVSGSKSYLLRLLSTQILCSAKP